MEQPNRNYTDGTYRYGFQGQEKDDELKGKGNSVNYKYRMHDPRVGRFFAIDPLAPEYPWNSTYAFSENRVVDAYELEGLEAKLYTSKEENEKGIYSYDKGQVLEDATTVGESWDRKGFRIQLYEKNGVHFYVLSRIDKKNTTYLSDIYGKMLQGAYVVTSKEGFAHIMQNSEKFYNRSIQQFHDNTINAPIENPVVRFIANGGLGLFSGGSIRGFKNLKKLEKSVKTGRINWSGGKKKLTTTSTSRIGSWMTPDEYIKTMKTGQLQERSGGLTHVLLEGKHHYKDIAGKMYVEFDIPAGSTITRGSGQGWGIFYSPNSSIGKLNSSRGLNVTQPKISNIKIIDRNGL